jgi:hypothetical protein
VIALGERPQSPAAAASRRPSLRLVAWLGVSILVVALAVAFVRITAMSPAYDAYGWLVWGHQALRGTLNLNSAPSWKPLPFLFTLPYSLLGKQTAFWLWLYTAVTAAFAAPVFGGRCAYWLVHVPGARRWPALVAAVAAGAGVLGILGYWHFILVGYADPLMVALTLAAVDFHLCGRRRAAWAMVVLVALGRPEMWVVGLLYAAWTWRMVPVMRRYLVAGILLQPLLWVGVSRLASHFWLVSSHIDKLSTAGFHIHGTRVAAVLDGFFSLYELPVQIAAACALALALVRRDRRALWLFAAAAAWLLTDVALAIHGELPVPRYMFEAAAVEVTLVGAGAGWILASRPRPAVLRWVGAAAGVALLAVMAPNIRYRGRVVHNGIRLGRTWTKVIRRLNLLVGHEGGTRGILACGTAVTTVPFQSILAWQLGLNVRQVNWVPDTWIASGKPGVVFTNFYAGWQVRVYHPMRSDCNRLVRDTPSN